MALNFRAHKLQLTWRKWGELQTLKERMLTSPPREPTSNEKYTNLCSDLMGQLPQRLCGQKTSLEEQHLAPSWSKCVLWRAYNVISVSKPTKQINGSINSIYWHICQQSTSSTMGKCHFEDKDRWNLYTWLSQFKNQLKKVFCCYSDRDSRVCLGLLTYCGADRSCLCLQKKRQMSPPRPTLSTQLDFLPPPRASCQPARPPLGEKLLPCSLWSGSASECTRHPRRRKTWAQ